MLNSHFFSWVVGNSNFYLISFKILTWLIWFDGLFCLLASTLLILLWIGFGSLSLMYICLNLSGIIKIFTKRVSSLWLAVKCKLFHMDRIFIFAMLAPVTYVSSTLVQRNFIATSSFGVLRLMVFRIWWCSSVVLAKAPLASSSCVGCLQLKGKISIVICICVLLLPFFIFGESGTNVYSKINVNRLRWFLTQLDPLLNFWWVSWNCPFRC